MSNVFLAYVTLVVGLIVSTVSMLMLPRARPDFRAWHWVVVGISGVLLTACVLFFGMILLESPPSRAKPELLLPFLLAILVILVLGWKLIRGGGASDKGPSN